MSNVGELLHDVSGRLGSLPEARWILSRAANSACFSRAGGGGGAGGAGGAAHDGLLTRVGDHVPESVELAVAEMVERRLSGEPIQYVLGTWDFRMLEVRVDRRVLIPRPETEELVSYALEELARQRLAGESGRDSFVAADLGTGSGVIALSLAVEAAPDVGRWGRPGNSRAFRVWATDSSTSALEAARENLLLAARRHPTVTDQVRLSQGKWFEALPRDLAGTVRLVVSNPPYVSESEWLELDRAVRDYEPRDALVPGETGLEALETLVRGAPRWLASGGSLVVELAPHQADAVAHMAESEGYVNVQTHRDLAGKVRVLVARLR